MKNTQCFKLLLLVLLLSCNNEISTPIEANIIPKPFYQKTSNQIFLLDNKVSLKFSEENKTVANYFNNYIEKKYNIEFTNGKEKQIEFKISSSIENSEGYELAITENDIIITSKTQKGAFYAIQSLLQLLPMEAKSRSIAIQGITVRDIPRFQYRGMHLDVARHFFSVDFIKKYIDLMAMLKMNTFHWHLTEDQGWRIEIKKYPKLQEIAAFRNETLIGHYSDQPHQFDAKKYGGFYTQEEIKEVVKYATERQITVIPEIEMPGHSQAAIAAYPYLGCSGEQIKTATKWGVFEEIYCPRESTFQFLEDVIDEVVELFPSKYIHIGGDEAPKTKWKNCQHCQKLIKNEGLKDEHELQSYFITRIEKYINSKGKQIIGWDEILEGGLAPNATVMSWRGFNGAIEAAKQKHDVILTPSSHCYFDHYQSDNENEPLAIGGFLPLEKVYSFEPIPPELSEEDSKYVLGAQGNVWTEYISTPEKLEYMTFPRAIALSEVVWSSTENKNYKDFIERLEHFNKRLDAMNINYANHIYEVRGRLVSDGGNLTYELKTTADKKILYSLDNDEMILEYKNPIKISNSTKIKAAVFDNQQNKLGNTFNQIINLHKAVGANVSINVTPHKSYNTGGKEALVNGISGNSKRYGDSEWLGFFGEDVEITIELDEFKEINQISTRFHNGNGQWIYAPKEILISFDGNQFEKNILDVSKELLVNFKKPYKGIKTKIIKLKIPNYGVIPEGRQGSGNKAWTFIDEIIIE